jgi:hypothetical protein
MPGGPAASRLLPPLLPPLFAGLRHAARDRAPGGARFRGASQRQRRWPLGGRRHADRRTCRQRLHRPAQLIRRSTCRSARALRPAARPPVARRPLPPWSRTRAASKARSRSGRRTTRSGSSCRPRRWAPFLLSPKIKSGIGEGLAARRVDGLSDQRRRRAAGGGVRARAQPGAAAGAQHRRRGPPGTPEARAVEASTAPACSGSTAVASAAAPRSKSVLVEANGCSCPTCKAWA